MILINFLSVQGGGSLTYFINITPKLIALDKNQDFLFLVSNSNFQYLSNKNSSILKFKDKFIVFDDKYSGKKRFFSYFKIKRLISKYSIKRVFTPYQIALLFPNVENILMIRNMEPFNYFKYKYDIQNRLRNYLLNKFSKYFLKKADTIVAVSKYSEFFLLRNLEIPKDKIVHIYHGKDVNFSPKIMLNDKNVLKKFSLKSKNYILTVGSLLPYRKLEVIINSYINQTKTFPYLVVAGDGNDKKYKRTIKSLIQKNNLEDRVLLLGNVIKSDLEVLYRNSRLFLTATEVEACPNIAIESMAFGCAIIAANTKPLKEIYSNSAIYFEQDDYKILRENILSILNNVKKREQMSKISRERADFFSWEKCSYQTYKLLND